MDNKSTSAQKPEQRVSWSKKISKDYQFFKDTADYIISNSTFGGSDKVKRRAGNIQGLRDIYASIFPKEWFKHLTDPHQIGEGVQWPAKIRPLNIIKPNLDYLRGKYAERPFPVQISVLGDQGYSSFLSALQDATYKNLSQQFVNEVNSEIEGQEVEGVETGVESQAVEVPNAIKEKFSNEYKDNLAVQADADLSLIVEEQRVVEQLEEQFNDSLVVGEYYSYKDIIRDETVYERVVPEELDYSISPGLKYIKDANWVVRGRQFLPVDICDMFYDSLSEKDLKQIHNRELVGESSEGLINLYHACWRSEEKVGIRTYFSPETQELEMDEVADGYVADIESGETVEWIWRSIWLEVYRIGDSSASVQPIYVDAGKVRYSPNYINNLAKTEGPYNGRIFSPESTHNTSVLKIGIPFLISYIIGHFALEKIIARGGGKVALIDQAIIPKDNGWTDAKFIQYAEAKGWALMNRQQAGVDKSFNQYQVMDLSMYDHISKIIEMMDFAQSQYDTQIGITRQAKGDIQQRDSVSGTKDSIVQSSIITEMLFSDFERYKLTEYQGLIHCSQLSARNGKRRLYTTSDGRKALLDINPDEYCYAQLGVMAVINPLETNALEKMRNYGQALAQNGVEASTLLQIETARSIPRLKELLLETERTRAEMEQAQANAENEAKERLISLEKEFERISHSLEIDYMQQEYDRKQDLVVLQGDINMAIASAQTGEEVSSANPALDSYMKYQTDTLKVEEDINMKNKIRMDKKKESDKKLKIQEDDAKHKRELSSKESAAKIAAIKLKAKQSSTVKRN